MNVENHQEDQQEDQQEKLIDPPTDKPADDQDETADDELAATPVEFLSEEVAAAPDEEPQPTTQENRIDETIEEIEAVGEALDTESIDELIAESETEEAERIRTIASNEILAQTEEEHALNGSSEPLPQQLDLQSIESDDNITATREELKPVIESLLFVADEPLPFKQICKVLGEAPEDDVRAALDELTADYDARQSGLEIREIAGGWRISTRPQNHEFVRKYLKSRPSARLSLPALETLAVIAYKQPITVPEILEIRGVTSSSAIKTLLEKRLIVTKGRKETVGRPMMYGTSKEFLIQFGLKDLGELPNIEDFEDLAQ